MESISFDSIGKTRRLDIITVLSSMGVFMDGYVLSIFSTAEIFLKSGFLDKTILLSIGASSIFIGMFAGSVFFGNLSDSDGRKKVFTYDLAFSAIFLILTGLSTNFLSFVLFQILAGIGIGADYPISSSIQAEFTPKKIRGKYLVFNIFSWSLGSIFFYILSIPIYLYTGPDAWRYMYISAAFIPFLALVLRKRMPESPYYLMSSGHYGEAQDVVRQFGEEAGIKNIRAPSVSKERKSLAELRKYFPLIFFTSVAWFSYDVSSYGIWNYTPSIFIGSSNSYLAGVIGTLLEEVPVIAGTILCLLLIDSVGRRKLEYTGFALAGISLFLYSIYSMHFMSSFALLFAAFAMMHFFHNIGPTNITYLYPSEVFPTNMRGTGTGIATASSRVGAIMGVFLFPIIVSSLSLSYGLLFFAIFEFMGFAVTLKYAPETKGVSLK